MPNNQKFVIKIFITMADQENSPIVYKNHEIAIPPKLAEKLSGVSVSFDSKSWKQEKMDEVCTVIAELTNLRTLELWGNQNKVIIKSISLMKFPLLKLLNIQGNNIQSIEDLQIMNLKFLQTIYLFGNSIYTISTLRKTNWSSMKTLSLYSNYIKDSQLLWLAPFQTLDSISIEWFQDENEQFFNLNSMGKLETKKLTKIYMESKTRIKQENVKNKLEKKCPNLTLKVHW